MPAGTLGTQHGSVTAPGQPAPFRPTRGVSAKSRPDVIGGMLAWPEPGGAN